MSTTASDFARGLLPSQVAERSATGPYTPDDLLAWPEDGVFELVNGHIVEKPMGNESGLIIVEIAALLREALQLRGLGYVFSEGWLKCFPGRPNFVRRADVVFAAASHFRDGEPIPEMFTFAPELAVEVTSPPNRSDETERRVREYHAAGIPLVWVAHPPERIIRVCKPDRTSRVYEMGDSIATEPQLPGLTLRVADVFRR